MGQLEAPVERDIGVGWQVEALALCCEQLWVGLKDGRREGSVVSEGDRVDRRAGGGDARERGLDEDEEEQRAEDAALRHTVVDAVPVRAEVELHGADAAA